MNKSNIKRSGNRNLKIIAATSMTIFSLASVFVATIAWFTSVRNYDQSSTNFEVKSVSGVLNKITFHKLEKFDQANSYSDIKFYFNKTAVGTLTYDWNTNSFKSQDNTNVELDYYNYLDHECPLLMLIELYEEINYENDKKTVSITLNTDLDDQKFMGTRENNVPKYDLSKNIIKSGTVTRDSEEFEVNYYGLSNVTKFFTIQFDEDSYETFNENDYFEVTHLDEQKSFVTINNSSDTSSFSNTVNLLTTNQNVKYIAVIVDYYSDAIEYIYSTYLGDSTLEDTYDNYLYFVCDWSMEVR